MENNTPLLILENDTPTYLNYYCRLDKTDKKHWWELDFTTAKLDAKFMSCLKDISLLKLRQSKNVILQKMNLRGNKYAIRIAISVKHEERWIGTFNDTTEGSILLITHKMKPYLEIFISETVKNNSFALLQKLEEGVLDNEIRYYRREFEANKD